MTEVEKQGGLLREQGVWSLEVQGEAVNSIEYVVVIPVAAEAAEVALVEVERIAEQRLFGEEGFVTPSVHAGVAKYQGCW